MTGETRHDTAHGRQADTSTSTTLPSRNSTLGLPWGARGRTKGDRRGFATNGACTYEWHRRSWKNGHRAPRGTRSWVVHVTLPGPGRENGTEFEKLFTAVKSLIFTFLPHGGGTAHSKNVPRLPHTTGTNQHRNKQGTYAQKIRLRKRPLQRQGTNAEQTNQDAANTTAHQQNHCSDHAVTIHRPHARRPTPNWPDMHGWIRKRRPTGWPRRGVPCTPTTMPTSTAEHRNSTTTNTTNQR